MSSVATPSSSSLSLTWPLALLAGVPGLAAVALSIELALIEIPTPAAAAGVGVALAGVAGERLLRQARHRREATSLAKSFGVSPDVSGGETWAFCALARRAEVWVALREAALELGRAELDPAAGTLLLRTEGSLRSHGDRISVSLHALDRGLVSVRLTAAPVHLASQANPLALQRQLAQLTRALQSRFTLVADRSDDREAWQQAGA